MTRMMRAATVAAALGLAMSACGFAAAAERPAVPGQAPTQLSDSQLDKVAGGGGTAVADGGGRADGKSARSGATVSSFVRTDAIGAGGGALGQASASATASPGALATASSSLSLSVTLP